MSDPPNIFTLIYKENIYPRPYFTCHHSIREPVLPVNYANIVTAAGRRCCWLLLLLPPATTTTMMMKTRRRDK